MPEYPVYGAGNAIVEAVEADDRAATLRELAVHIAQRIADGVAARDLAALSKRLTEVQKELEALDATDDADAAAGTDDELARRRAAVLSAAGVQPAEAGGDARAAGR